MILTYVCTAKSLLRMHGCAATGFRDLLHPQQKKHDCGDKYAPECAHFPSLRFSLFFFSRADREKYTEVLCNSLWSEQKADRSLGLGRCRQLVKLVEIGIRKNPHEPSRGKEPLLGLAHLSFILSLCPTFCAPAFFSLRSASFLWWVAAAPPRNPERSCYRGTF